MKKNCLPCPQLVIPSTFQNCFTYAKQVEYLYSICKDLSAKVDELDKRVTELENKA